MRIAGLIAAVTALLALNGCGQTPSAPTVHPQGRKFAPVKIPTNHLPNAFRIHDKVISGGQPDGDAAFLELLQLGVRTVISVDSARPDVATAAKFGLRYVHLPHGYDGIPEQRAWELAKAVRDLEGPIYIHCHHGHHRSPAAAAVACVSAGLIDPSAAAGILQAAGTSKNYRGLHQSAEAATRLDKTLLDALQAEFPETAKLPPLAEAMVEIEKTHDHLKTIAAAGWITPPDNPDLDPAHEALLLKEHFAELLRSEVDQPSTFQGLLRESQRASEELESLLRESEGPSPVPREKLSAEFSRVSAHCTACHRQFRDVPLAEKK
jgi:protein tyrosine phosphatase (PTP) superfamily phosphohydrolase (DUF442 family)